MVPSNMASALSDDFPSMHHLFVAGHGASDPHTNIDYCDKLQEQT